jgi:hypothetical protein
MDAEGCQEGGSSSAGLGLSALGGELERDEYDSYGSEIVHKYKAFVTEKAEKAADYVTEALGVLRPFDPSQDRKRQISLARGVGHFPGDKRLQHRLCVLFRLSVKTRFRRFFYGLSCLGSRLTSGTERFPRWQKRTSTLREISES